MSMPIHTAPLRSRLIPFLAALMMVVLSTAAEPATLGRPWTLDRAVGQSGLVFEGTVTAISFRDSVPTSFGQAALPHTFVTYSVTDVIRGTVPSRTITLRFLGGWSGASGRIMRLPQAPLFKVGDRDVLFVGGNGAAACPLIGCGLGRFRVWEGRVHSDLGLAIRRQGERDLAPGPDRMPDDLLRMEFPPAPERRLAELRRQFADASLSADDREALGRRIAEMTAPRTITLGRQVSDGSAPPPSTPPLAVADFKALIREIAGRNPPAPPPVVSVSPEARFEYPLQELTQRQPPRRFAGPRELTPEQRQLRRNNGNPVLKAQ